MVFMTSLRLEVLILIITELLIILPMQTVMALLMYMDSNTGSLGTPVTSTGTDTNSDGITKLFITQDNSDGDSNQNFLDLDSDNDGCNDTREAGYTDTDNNGTLGATADTVDANGQITGDGGYTGTNANVTTAGTSQYNYNTAFKPISNFWK